MAVTCATQGWPGTGGSGPAPGSIGITNTSSVSALKNYYPKGGGVEFVYAPKNTSLATGVVKRHVQLSGSRHEQLAAALGEDFVVGGMLARGANGEFLTSEQSGHFGDSWTPAIRDQFRLWLSARTGFPVIHHYWQQK